VRRQVVIAALSILLIAAVGASLDYTIDQDVLGSGAHNATSADYALEATLGQPATGLSASQNYDLCSGFWCDVNASSTAVFGKATILYRWTFDEIGISAAMLALITLFAGRWLYDLTNTLWTRRLA